MKPHSNNKAKFKGKKAPLFFACLYLLLCFVSIFSIDPVLWFLKYAALFGVLTAVLLISYIIQTKQPTTNQGASSNTPLSEALAPILATNK